MAAPAALTRIQKTVYNALGGSSIAAVFWPGTEIGDAIVNASYQVLMRLSPGYQGRIRYDSLAAITLTGTGSATAFNLATSQNVTQILSCKFSDDFDKEYASITSVTASAADWTDYIEDNTRVVYIEGKYINIVPAMPVGVTATVEYIAFGDDYTTIYNFIPHRYYDAIARYAIWDLNHKDPKWDSADLRAFFQEYQASFAEAMAYDEDFADNRPTIVDTAGYDDFFQEL